MTALSVYRATSLGYQQYTSTGSAFKLTSAPSTGNTGIPSGARYAVIYVEGAGIRWRDDGTAPTASVGMPVSAGQDFQYSGQLESIQMIQQASGAIVNVTWYA